MLLNKYWYLPFLLILISCNANLKSNKLFEDRLNIDATNIHEFNGSYNPTSIDSSYTLLEFAFFNETFNYEKSEEPKQEHLTLEILDNNTIEASYHENGILLKRKELKYDLLENGYLNIRAPSKLHNSYWVFFTYVDIETRIALSKNKNLILDSCSMGTAFFLILPIIAADNHEYGSEHLRINKR